MWEEGLKVVEECIEKARMILDGYQPGQLFTSEDYIKYYEYPFYVFIYLLDLYIVVLHAICPLYSYKHTL